MNYTQKLMKKAEPLIEELKKLKEVEAMAFYGSVGSGMADKYSDIDIVCFCKIIPKKETRKKVLIRLGAKEKLEQDEVNAFWIDDVAITLWFKKISDLNFLLDKFFKEKSNWAEKDISIYIDRTKVIYDPKKIVKKWENKIKKYPAWLRKLNVKKIENTGYFDMILTEIERKNFMWCDRLLVDRLEWCIQSVYALNKRYYSVFKWFEKEEKTFKIKPKNFYERVKIIDELRSRINIVKKLNLLSDLIEDIFKLCRKEYPELKFVYNYEQRKEKIKKIENLLETKKIYD